MKFLNFARLGQLAICALAYYTATHGSSSRSFSMDEWRDSVEKASHTDIICNVERHQSYIEERDQNLVIEHSDD